MIRADRIMIQADRIMIRADRIMIRADRIMIRADPDTISRRPDIISRRLEDAYAPPVPVFAGLVANPAGSKSTARGFARLLTQRQRVPPGSVGVSSVGGSSAGAASGAN